MGISNNENLIAVSEMRKGLRAQIFVPHHDALAVHAHHQQIFAVARLNGPLRIKRIEIHRQLARQLLGLPLGGKATRVALDVLHRRFKGRRCRRFAQQRQQSRPVFFQPSCRVFFYY